MPRSDVENVKHVVTADTLDRRPMRKNSIMQVRQCATFLGASNKDVAENIRDDTGARRFVGLDFIGAPRGYLERLDWRAAWRSVKHTDTDPMDAHRDRLRAVQAANRHLSPVEDWMAHFDTSSADAILKVQGHLRIKPLYDDYLTHRNAVTGDRDPVQKTMDQFALELSRLTKQAAGESKLIKHRDGQGVYYRLRESTKLRVVD